MGRVGGGGGPAVFGGKTGGIGQEAGGIDGASGSGIGEPFGLNNLERLFSLQSVEQPSALFSMRRGLCNLWTTRGIVNTEIRMRQHDYTREASVFSTAPESKEPRASL